MLAAGSQRVSAVSPFRPEPALVHSVVCAASDRHNFAVLDPNIHTAPV